MNNTLPPQQNGCAPLSELNEELTLAEALQLRGELQTAISKLRARLSDNAKVQDGDEPAEDPLVLLKLLKDYAESYEKLVCRINMTNSLTVDESGKPLTALLSKRDALKLYVGVLQDFAKEASQKVDRYSKTEIIIRSTVNVPQLQKLIDGTAMELRKTDTAIQRLNWSTKLI